MSRIDHLHLFEGYGIEMEYMIVDRDSLAVRPLTDFVLTKAAGKLVNEVSLGDLAWSNELVLHVIELKTDGPAPRLQGLDKTFLKDIQRVNAILAEKNAMLMPTAMHPFMDPFKDTQLWTHDDATIYEAYDRIFGCKGHGWSNLQSIHINLPFFDDAEFGKLHAAIRLVLPVLPGLAASSPIYEGRPSGLMDSRLEFYRQNQKAVPSITGQVIPEPAFTKQEYADKIYAKLKKDIAPHDPDGVMEEEWLNSRGAIARFDRNAIEIRVLDIQESPRMDVALIATVVSLVHALADGVFLPLEKQKKWSEEPLSRIFFDAVQAGGDSVVTNSDYLAVFGFGGKSARIQDLWRHIALKLLAKSGYPINDFRADAEVLIDKGTLASRLMKALGPTPSRDEIASLYRGLCRTLAEGGRFDGAS